MDPDILHSNGHQGVNLSIITADLPQHPHREAHPKPRGILGPLKRRAVSSMDLPMHSGGWSLGSA